jgi:hypothetical protein
MIAEMEQAKPAGPTIRRGKSKQDVQTDPEFMKAVKFRFGEISFDLAASSENTQHSNFFSKEQNSMIQQWHKIPGWLWLNCEFDRIEPWAIKCADESALGAKILLLTPASVGANWFSRWVSPNAYVLALNGRLKFVGHTQAYPKDCTLSVFCAGLRGFDTWNWKQK